MLDFENLIRHENAHSGLTFRARAYRKGEHDQLIRDLIGLANASFTGPRFLVIGVDVQAGSRSVQGIEQTDLTNLQNLLPRIAARLIEPALTFTLDTITVKERLIAIVTIRDCSDPPYLLTRDLSRVMHAGRGWIRRGAELFPLMRDDLQRMLTSRGPDSDRAADLSIGFPGKILSDEISLPALPLDAMPSKMAAERLQRILEGKNRARDAFGRTQTQFNRLLHAQVFGSDHAFEPHSDTSIIKELEQTDEQHAAADLHYEFEERAHEVQFEVRNDSEFEVDRALLQLTISRLDGVEVADQYYGSGTANGYPLVDVSQRKTIVQAEIGRIPAGGSRNAFREALRLCLREAAVGKTVLIDYKLQSRALSRPLTGSFRIHIEAAQSESGGAEVPRARSA
jgi:hypothetical protein